jgi:hypothetical protein
MYFNASCGVHGDCSAVVDTGGGTMMYERFRDGICQSSLLERPTFASTHLINGTHFTSRLALTIPFDLGKTLARQVQKNTTKLKDWRGLAP